MKGFKSRPLHRGCGLKFLGDGEYEAERLSPSSQRVWIEIVWAEHQIWQLCKVALFTEGVDWNTQCAINKLVRIKSPSSQRVWIEIYFPLKSIIPPVVALFTEGVDWNRRNSYNRTKAICVALFTEGVDWNRKMYQITPKNVLSPSSQRVWIEIENNALLAIFCMSPSSQRVWIEITAKIELFIRRGRRPLHRGCGLKWVSEWQLLGNL